MIGTCHVYAAGSDPKIEVTRAQVDAAKARMRQFLLQKQNAQTGAWETRSRSDSQAFGHTTALVTYSLLESNLSYQAPALTKALDFLSKLQGGDAYTMYPRFLCWSVLPDQFTPSLQIDAKALMLRQHKGLFYSDNLVTDEVDTSLLLYGVIGLHIASQRGVNVSPQNWESITNHLLGSQHNDGGWGKSDARSQESVLGASISAMTVLHICRLHLATYPNAVGPMTASLQRAERYLSQNWSPAIAPNSFDKTHSYDAALYSLYQLALLTRYSGVQTYGGEDWYRQGLETILKLEQGTGSIRGDMIETALGLLYLSQADACVWLNRLDVPTSNSTANMEDIYHLTRSISDLREYDLHWQVVRLDDPLIAWLTAPMLYVSSDMAIELTQEQKGRLKRYLDMGGLLVVNPEKNSKALSQSITQLAHELYPKLAFRPLDSEHPALSLLQQVKGISLHGLSSGTRDLILLLDTDLQLGSTSEALQQNQKAVHFWYNLYAWTTDRGFVTTRLDTLAEVPTQQPPVHEWSIVRTTCSSSEEGIQESMAWPLYAARLLNRARVKLSIQDMLLSDIDKAHAPLVHLSGQKAQVLTNHEIEAIALYVQRGGTLWVESVSGSNDFASSIRSQLQRHFKAHVLPLSVNATVYKAQPLLGLKALTRTPFRRFTVFKHGYSPFPRLMSIEIDGRDAIFFSDDDLTMGLLRIRRWGISGYRPDAAQNIVDHLLAWTSQNAAQLQPPSSQISQAVVQKAKD